MMGYINKYDRTFISFMNKKYKKYNVFLNLLTITDCGYMKIIAYMMVVLIINRWKKIWKNIDDFQTGKERDKRGKLDGNWEED